MSRCPCPLKRSSPLIQLQSSRTVSRSLCRKFTSLSVVLFIGVFVYLFDKEIAPAHKGLQFVKTRCTLNTSQITESVLCDCGVYTSSACYPCLLVLVWVNISERTTRDSNSQFGRDSAYLHENLYLLNHEVCTFMYSNYSWIWWEIWCECVSCICVNLKISLLFDRFYLASIWPLSKTIKLLRSMYCFSTNTNEAWARESYSSFANSTAQDHNIVWCFSIL